MQKKQKALDREGFVKFNNYRKGIWDKKTELDKLLNILNVIHVITLSMQGNLILYCTVS